MKQMREEQQRRRLVETKRNREIAQLKKEQRRQEFQIRALESQKRQQEMVLRRKTQEVSALRRLAKPMSERVAGRAGLKPPMLDSGAEVSASTTSSEAESGARSVSSIVRQWNRKINHFLGDHPAPSVNGTRPARKKFQKKGASQSFSKAARLKWQSLERRIIDIVMQRMTIVNLEADMERLIKKREELFLLQEALRRKRERLQAESPEEEKGLQELAEEIEVLAANIDYINDSITDCQATIVQLEETKVSAGLGLEELDSTDTSVVISSCSLAEARLLLDNFLKASIDKGLQVAQKEAQIRLLEGRLRQTDMAGSSQNHLLLDALREKAEAHPELQALIYNVQQGTVLLGSDSQEALTSPEPPPAPTRSPGLIAAENGYASTDEEISEFSEGSFSQSFTMKGSTSHDDFKFKSEPKLSAQMKAVSAECLGPPLDISTKNITKSLASLVEIKEDGVGFSVRDPYYRDKVSRTVSLPTRGSTL
ncbi:Kinesin-like protein kif21b [Saguinus oedipus]|uniref:Kinesin-like protein kif21b n=1 Tax=Saguinus oedipus TaxID=9490 RepID=A0ABQ9TN90_SAGOE|nr:Kinesin-like protein kif21b [Saguinus oedipus]